MTPISNVRSQPIQLHWQVFLAKKKERKSTDTCLPESRDLQKVSLLQVPGCSMFLFLSMSMMPESVLTADNIGSTDITGDGTGCYLTVYIYGAFRGKILHF